MRRPSGRRTLLGSPFFLQEAGAVDPNPESRFANWGQKCRCDVSPDFCSCPVGPWVVEPFWVPFSFSEKPVPSILVRHRLRQLGAEAPLSNSGLLLLPARGPTICRARGSAPFLATTTRVRRGGLLGVHTLLSELTSPRYVGPKPFKSAPELPKEVGEFCQRFWDCCSIGLRVSPACSLSAAIAFCSCSPRTSSARRPQVADYRGWYAVGLSPPFGRVHPSIIVVALKSLYSSSPGRARLRWGV